MDRVSGLRAALLGAGVMAVAGTFADALRAAAPADHRAAWGLVQGSIVLGALGYILAALVGARARVAAAVAAPLFGAAAAALFYLLYPLVDVAAMLLAWLLLWLALAFLTDVLAPAASESRWRTLTRGLAAGVLSGLGSWAVSAVWVGGLDPGPLYVRHLASWGVAFLPGLAALLWDRRGVD